MPLRWTAAEGPYVIVLSAVILCPKRCELAHVPVNDRIELILSAAPGQTVQLQYSSDLTSSSWINLGNPITATDTPGPDQPRFYRAIVVLP